MCTNLDLHLHLVAQIAIFKGFGGLFIKLTKFEESRHLFPRDGSFHSLNMFNKITLLYNLWTTSWKDGRTVATD